MEFEKKKKQRKEKNEEENSDVAQLLICVFVCMSNIMAFSYSTF